MGDENNFNCMLQFASYCESGRGDSQDFAKACARRAKAKEIV